MGSGCPGVLVFYPSLHAMQYNSFSILCWLTVSMLITLLLFFSAAMRCRTLLHTPPAHFLSFRAWHGRVRSYGMDSKHIRMVTCRSNSSPIISHIYRFLPVIEHGENMNSLLLLLLWFCILSAHSCSRRFTVSSTFRQFSSLSVYILTCHHVLCMYACVL